jgi:hypothetical protein
MLDLESRLQRRDDEVLAKVMDGEAVIINLSNGTYYSADGAACLIWSAVDDGLSLEDVAAEVAGRYEVPLPRAREDVLAFANELLVQELVAIAPEAKAARGVAASQSTKLPYEAPQLHVYRDMEELLALDPPTPGLADMRWKG